MDGLLLLLTPLAAREEMNRMTEARDAWLTVADNREFRDLDFME